MPKMQIILGDMEWKMKTKFKKFIEGMKNLTPAQQLHGQLAGHIGTIVGIIFAWVAMLFYHMWYFSIVMFFAIWLSVISYIGTRQKYVQVCKMMDEIKSSEPPKKLEPNIKEELK